jgi:hypothetical protein
MIGAADSARYPFFAALSGYRTPMRGICFSRNVGGHAVLLPVVRMVLTPGD